MALLEKLPKTKINKNKVLKILKKLYKLKQFKRIWNKIFKKIIKKTGFYFIMSDLYIFKKEMDNNNIYLIALYINNIIVIFAKKSMYRKIKEIITFFFKVTNSKELTKILGI